MLQAAHADASALYVAAGQKQNCKGAVLIARAFPLADAAALVEVKTVAGHAARKCCRQCRWAALEVGTRTHYAVCIDR